MKPAERRNQWRNTIERCLSSGLTIHEWCKLNKVPPSSLYGWMAKFRKEEADLFTSRNASEWIEITKQGLAESVALAPGAKKIKPTKSAVAITKNAAASSDAAATQSSPCILTRINGVEMSISPGCTQTDIEAVFKAAISLRIPLPPLIVYLYQRTPKTCMPAVRQEVAGYIAFTERRETYKEAISSV